MLGAASVAIAVLRIAPGQVELAIENWNRWKPPASGTPSGPDSRRPSLSGTPWPSARPSPDRGEAGINFSGVRRTPAGKQRCTNDVAEMKGAEMPEETRGAFEGTAVPGVTMLVCSGLLVFLTLF